MDYDEMQYNSKLKRFRKENETSSEIDFINTLIADLEKVLETLPEVSSDKDLLNKIESEYTDDQKKQETYKVYISQLLEREKLRISQNRQRLINEIEDLEIRKSRLPQQIEKGNEEEVEKGIPYKIALLNEIGFFELEAIKSLTKENQFKIINQLTGSPTRTIKGNVNILRNINSNEDNTKYTSNSYVDEVKNYLNKLT